MILQAFDALPLWRFAGDIRVTGANYVFYSPMGSCVLFSVLARLLQRVFAQPHAHQS
jgi:hypothetical protein